MPAWRDTDRIRPGAAALKSAGFTLLEMMVALAIFSVIAIMLTSITNQVLKTWLTGEADNQKRQNGRALADFVGNELRTAVLPLDPNSDAKKNLQLVLNPPALSKVLKSPDALFWQAPLATDSSAGDLAEIGYFLRWAPDDVSKPGSPLRGRLCRFFVNPTELNYRIYSNPTDWISDAIVNRVAPADRTSGYEGLFAEDVIAFWVRCLDPNGERITAGASGEDFRRAFDSRIGYKYKDPDPADPSKFITRVGHLPASIEVTLALIDSRTGAQLADAELKTIVSLYDVTYDRPEYAQDFARALPRRLLQAVRLFHTAVHLQNSR